jgi:hypothetical protein
LRDLVGLGDVVAVEEVNGVGADVIHFQGSVLGYFTLQRERPGLDVWIERIF